MPENFDYKGYRGTYLDHDKGETAAEAIIEVMLDDKETPSELKHWVKHTLVPMLEFIDAAEDPKETIDNLLRLSRFLAICTSYGISKAAKPTKWDVMASILENDYALQLKNVMLLTQEMRKKVEERVKTERQKEREREQGTRWK